MRKLASVLARLTPVLAVVLVFAIMLLVGVGVSHVPSVAGTWTHGEPERWTHLRLVEEDGRVVGDMTGYMVEAWTGAGGALPLHVAGSWDNRFLEAELGGFYYHFGEEGGVCSIEGEVEMDDGSLLAEWLGWRHPPRLLAVIRCPEEEPFPMVFEWAGE